MRTFFFYPFCLAALLTACKQPTAFEKNRSTSLRAGAFYQLPNRFFLLQQNAGKKEGLTQREFDSIQNINSLRKKF